MNKKNIFVSIIILLIIGFVVYSSNSNKNIVKDENLTSLHDGVYIVDGQKITLKNGLSEVEVAPGSASKIVTKYFGNEVSGDFDKDGREDTAFLITQETGGSGTFFYATALLNKVDGKVGTDAVFLGDRIAPQTTEIKDVDILVVNYLERKNNESFDVKPSIGKSIYLKLDPKTLQWGEVIQGFEGEADPAKMTLTMKKWNWVYTQYSDGKEVKPIAKDKFTLTLNKNNTFSATTDCNGGGGEYKTKGNEVTFSNMISTLMYCEDSQESDFKKMLNETQSYMFTSKGELVLLLKFDSGSVFFK
ncbi:MAG: META domain-containing protein [Candidatus Pacebacteria bacterium]|nr:META domain-containing protein [Candidatus Paceibacterota bacterium]